MTIEVQFETRRATARREESQIETLLRDLNRAVATLEADIAAEEARARVSDPADVAYPMLARVLAVRRQNLQTTIALFEQRLATLRQIFPERVRSAA